MGFLELDNLFIYIYIYIYIYTHTLINVTLTNDLLLKLYFKNFTVELHVLYILNMHTNIHVNQLLYTISSINSLFIPYFKLEKFESK